MKRLFCIVAALTLIVAFVFACPAVRSHGSNYFSAQAASPPETVANALYITDSTYAPPGERVRATSVPIITRAYADRRTTAPNKVPAKRS